MKNGIGMAQGRFTLVLAVLAFTLGLASVAAADPPGRVARLSYVNGAVSFLPGGLTEWAPAALNYPLTTGGGLWVDHDAWAELHIGSTAVRLAPQTNMSLLNVDDYVVQIRLTQGAVLLRIRQLFAGEVFEVDTPDGAVTLREPGVYRIIVDPARAGSVVTVRVGEADIATAGYVIPVVSGQAVLVAGVDGPTYDFRAPEPPDAWEAWASARDQREDRAAALRYVGPEVIGYEDLDDFGTWRVDATYGPLWVPTLVPAGWAPYRYGHWAWVEPWGWTWIDNASWGFAPFHYGRWVSLAGRWAWVPGTVVARPVYAPALVVFIGGVGAGAEIGWCPLGPREVYVPPYAVSSIYVQNINITSVNVTNINVTNVNVTNVTYRNRTVPGAVTMVSPDVLVGARPVAPAAVVFSASAGAAARILGMTAPFAPRRESVLAHPGGDGLRSVVRPPEPVLTRPVVAHVAPPPSPVPFAARLRALEATPGRPLDPQTLESLRRTQPSTALTTPALRPASGRDVPGATGGPAAPLKSAREGLPSPKPLSIEGFAPRPARAPEIQVIVPPVVPTTPPGPASAFPRGRALTPGTGSPAPLQPRQAITPRGTPPGPGLPANQLTPRPAGPGAPADGSPPASAFPKGGALTPGTGSPAPVQPRQAITPRVTPPGPGLPANQLTPRPAGPGAPAEGSPPAGAFPKGGALTPGTGAPAPVQPRQAITPRVTPPGPGLPANQLTPRPAGPGTPAEGSPPGSPFSQQAPGKEPPTRLLLPEGSK